MTTIGIVAGMPQELANLRTGLSKERSLYGIDFTVDRFEGKSVATAWAGVGKVAAAHAASTLIAKFNVSALIITGTAAALKAPPDRTFLIMKAFQHDYGADRASERVLYRPGQLPIGEPENNVFQSPLLENDWVQDLLETTISGEQILPAAIASGDVFMEDETYALALANQNVDLLDMETAAVAQVAWMAGVPWIGAKATTDAADAHSAEHFQDNLEQAAARAAELTRRVVQRF